MLEGRDVDVEKLLFFANDESEYVILEDTIVDIISKRPELLCTESDVVQANVLYPP